MEHHSNIVSWQLACERSGAELRWFGLTDDGHLDLSNADQLVDEHTKVVAFTWVSNMLGTINPVADLVARAKPSAPCRSSTPRRPRRSCRSTCRRPGATSWSSPATR